MTGTISRTRNALVCFSRAAQTIRRSSLALQGSVLTPHRWLANGAYGSGRSTSVKSLHPGNFWKETFGTIANRIEQVQGTKRLIHTTQPKHAIPIWLLIKPLAKVGTIITGRSLRMWWKKLSAEEKQRWLKILNLSRHKIAVTGMVLLAAGGVYYRAHVQEAPITKRKRFIAFTADQFRKIVQFEYEVQMESIKDKVLTTSHPVYSQVARVIGNIVNANQDLELMKNQTWTLILVDSKEKNAFVLPTGHIFVYTGLLNMVQNADQLAVVIGHEMAHAVLSHGAERVSLAHLADFFVILAMAAIWFFMPTDGFAAITQWFSNKVMQLLLHLPYDRMLEAEADEVGLQLISKACYDVRESSNFWDLMQLVNQAESKDGKEIEIPEWLSTHPSNENRAEALEKLIPHAISIRESCNCPRLPARDPRVTMMNLKAVVSEPKDTKEESPNVQAPLPGVTLIPNTQQL